MALLFVANQKERCANMADKKPITIIKSGDMSPETKALPDQTHPAPKGTGEVDMGPVVKKAKGGSASSRADGCCKKGKTKGRMV